MKVLVIMGSGRRGNTWHAAERIRGILQEKESVDWEAPAAVDTKGICGRPAEGSGKYVS